MYEKSKPRVQVDVRTTTPLHLIAKTIEQYHEKFQLTAVSGAVELSNTADDYLLKVAGFQLYLLDNVPLIQFHVRGSLLNCSFKLRPAHL
jgi:hypothetical protein